MSPNKEESSFLRNIWEVDSINVVTDKNVPGDRGKAGFYFRRQVIKKMHNCIYRIKNNHRKLLNSHIKKLNVVTFIVLHLHSFL